MYDTNTNIELTWLYGSNGVYLEIQTMFKSSCYDKDTVIEINNLAHVLWFMGFFVKP